MDATGVEREAIVQVINSRYDKKAKELDASIKTAQTAREKAATDRSGLAKASSVVPKAQPAPNGTPKVGEIRKGYSFLGGDPANKSSWQKVP